MAPNPIWGTEKLPSNAPRVDAGELHASAATRRMEGPRAAPRLTEKDRLFWVFLSRVRTKWRHSLHVVRPETVVRWHGQGFRRYWAWKSRRRSGRPRSVRSSEI